jgi:hypothetical protein
MPLSECSNDLRATNHPGLAMTMDARELNELTSKATELMAETADVPRMLRNRLGEQHYLAQAATDMQVGIETLVRELRRFDVSARSLGPTHSRELD